jgi:phage protein D
VLVSGYDAAAASVIDERVGNEAIAAEVGQGRTGPQLVATALGTSQAIRFREVAQSGEQARAWATAEMLRRARAFVTVDGLTRGSPDMVVGSIVELQDVGRPFEGGGYYVTRICHTYDLASGLRTRFEAERGTVNTVN